VRPAQRHVGGQVRFAGLLGQLRRPVELRQRLGRPAGGHQRDPQPGVCAGPALDAAMGEHVIPAAQHERQALVRPLGQAQQHAEPAERHLRAQLVTGRPVALDGLPPGPLRPGHVPALRQVVAASVGAARRDQRRQRPAAVPLVENAQHRAGIGAPVGASVPLGQVEQILRAGVHGEHGRGRRVVGGRGGPDRRGTPARRRGQRQVLHDRLRPQPPRDPVTLVAAAVAGVEARRQLGRRAGQRLGQVGHPQLGRRIPAGRPAVHGQVAVPRRGEPAQHQSGRAGELHRRVRRRRPVQPVQVSLHDLQAARVVAGQRTEDQVFGHVHHVRHVAAQRPVRPPVRGTGLVQPTGTQIRHEQLGQHRLRLLGAGQPAGEDRLGQRHRLGVPTPVGQVHDPLGGVAAGAVGVLVPRRGAPALVPVVGGRLIADVPGQQPPQVVDGVQAVPARPVAALHVVQDRPRPLQRDLRKLRQRRYDVLEEPAQQPVVDRVAGARIGVELAQAPGKGDERLRRLTAPVVRRGGEHPGVEGQARVPQRVGEPHGLLRRRDLAGTVGQVPALTDQAAHVVGPAPAGGHASPPGTARRSRPRKELLSRAASAGRMGW
jgi:hypothetical protein